MDTLSDATPTVMPRATAFPVPGAVADTMRRVQAQLAAGAAPSFESLLAFGEPGRG